LTILESPSPQNGIVNSPNHQNSIPSVNFNN
jgi:hypothetical protein